MAGIELFRITLRRLLETKRTIVILAITVLPALLAPAIASRSRVPNPFDRAFFNSMFYFYLWFVMMFVALINCINITHSEIEDGTVTYSARIRLKRWLIILWKQLAIIVYSWMVLSVGIFLTYFSTQADKFDVAVPANYSIIALAGCFMYCSLYTLCGYFFKSPVAGALLITFFVEIVLTHLPAKFSFYTVTNTLRAMIVSSFPDLTLKYKYAFAYIKKDFALLESSEALACALIITGVSWMLSSIVFSRRDLITVSTK